MSSKDNDSDDIYDCVVVGLGGHGSSTVANLGLKVLGIEQFPALHTEGSSHGRTRIYRQAYYEDPSYVPLLKRSLELWLELDEYYQANIKINNNSIQQQQQPDKLLCLCGGVMIGHPESEVITGVLQSIQQYNMPHKIYNATMMKEKYGDVFNLSDEEIGIFEESAGYLFPEYCIETYNHIAIANKAILKYDEAMIKYSKATKQPIDDNDDDNDDDTTTATNDSMIITVQTTKGIYKTRKLVLTVGAWATDVYGEILPFKLKIERRVLYWFQPNHPEDYPLFTNIPIYIWDLGNALGNFYGFPSETGSHNRSGDRVKVAFHLSHKSSEDITTTSNNNNNSYSNNDNSSHSSNNNSNPPNSNPSNMIIAISGQVAANISRQVSITEVNEIREVLEKKIPKLNSKLIETTTCMYTTTPDCHFLIDFHPKSKNIIIASPCSGHGFKFVSVVGEIIKDLVTIGKTQHDLDLFKISNNRYN